jgi:hypothetical protein
MGPWDRQPVRSAGRLANYLDLHVWHFVALALDISFAIFHPCGVFT